VFKASAVSKGGQVFAVEYATAEIAARSLLIVLKANGWTGDQEAAVASLSTGEPLEFKGATYKVEQVS
jgi:hypothetical protein